MHAPTTTSSAPAMQQCGPAARRPTGQAARCPARVLVAEQPASLAAPWRQQQSPVLRHGFACLAAQRSNADANVASSSTVHQAVISSEDASTSFDSVPDALAAVAAGEIVVVLDDEDRENEGDLIMAADKATPEALHFIVEHSSGVVCVGLEGADCDRLGLPLMVSSRENDESMYTAFTVTVDLREGTSTGISAADRAATCAALADSTATPSDFRRPGHIFPLRSRPGGVLTRPGHTEASVDLARLAGCAPAGIMCEVVNKADGSMARTPQLLAFAKQHGLRCVTIADLLRHRLASESLASLSSSRSVSTPAGEFSVHEFVPHDGVGTALVLQRQGGAGGAPGLLHVASADVLADVFGADGGSGGLQAALAQVGEMGGCLVYLQGRPAPPEQVGKVLSRYSCGAGRAADLVLAASLLRQLGTTLLRSSRATDVDVLRDFGIDASAELMMQHSANGGRRGNGSSHAANGAGVQVAL